MRAEREEMGAEGKYSEIPLLMFCNLRVFSHFKLNFNDLELAISAFVTETSLLNNIIINKSMFMEYTCAVGIVKHSKTCIGNHAAVCYGELHLSHNEASCHTAAVVDSQTPHICCLIGCFLIHSLPEEIL
jgi:hypothetical protein